MRRLCEIIKHCSSNRKDHANKNQNRSAVQHCFCPFFHLGLAQYKKELDIQKHCQYRAEKDGILIIVHGIRLRTFCKAEAVLQIAGKQMLYHGIIDLCVIRSKALLKPLQESGSLAVKPGRNIQKHLCHGKKYHKAHPHTQKDFSAAQQKSPHSLCQCQIIQHQNPEKKIKSCGSQTHVGEIHAVDSAEKYHHRKESSSFFLLDKFFAEKQKQRNVDHCCSKLIMLSPHQKETAEAVCIGDSQLCPGTKGKLR